MADDVRELLHEEAPAPSEALDVDALWRRGRRRRAVTGVSTLVGALGVVAVGVVLGSVLGTTPEQPEVAAEPPHGRVDVPEGWQAVERFGLALSIPEDWDVLEVDACWPTPSSPTLLVATRPLEACDRAVTADAPQFALLQPLAERRPPAGNWRVGELRLSVSRPSRDDGPIVRTALASSETHTIRLTMVGTEGGLGDGQDIMLSLRPVDGPTCVPEVCPPPPAAHRLPVGYEVVSHDGLVVHAEAYNDTDEPLMGGQEWHLHRWSGERWTPIDVGDSWTLLGVILPARDGDTGQPGRGAPIHARLPAVAGWYRIAKTMPGAPGGALLVTPPIPVESSSR